MQKISLITKLVIGKTLENYQSTFNLGYHQGSSIKEITSFQLRPTEFFAT